MPMSESVLLAAKESPDTSVDLENFASRDDPATARANSSSLSIACSKSPAQSPATVVIPKHENNRRRKTRNLVQHMAVPRERKSWEFGTVKRRLSS